MVEKKNEEHESCPASDPASDPSAGLAAVNDVRLVGRISEAPRVRSLPSGDQISTFRVVVDRLESATQSRAKVDVLDCVAWAARLRSQVSRWDAGDTVEVRGALRRRFFRSVAGRTESRTEVEVFSGRLRRRAAT